ncbi:MAG: hypothetical protein OXI15_02120 [Chromatiales bacterium]|nr:hypothetical protein [Chromatiales bacterium]
MSTTASSDARRRDRHRAVCEHCSWHDQLVAPDPVRTAIAELVTDGLWTEHHE